MSAAHSRAVVDRLVAKHNVLGPEDFAAYAFLAFGILAHHAPEVVEFVLERADQQVADQEETR